jgi:hypothetical protein
VCYNSFYGHVHRPNQILTEMALPPTSGEDTVA